MKTTSVYDAARGDAFHAGVDVAPKRDGKVVSDANALAVTDGIVVRIGASGFGPNAVIVKTPEGNRAAYGHLDSTTLKVNDPVKVGDVIGTIGSQGFEIPKGVLGTHLHFEVMTDQLFGDKAMYLGVLRANGVYQNK
ncbi:M23 family metallopeptidase [Undibacterium sp. MH2W]|uniref:M23 family metallopeptidase n=1 Tax=Undibacterium sp. MH2W TaxID=3413044 RepID=UPI003BF39846